MTHHDHWPLRKKRIHSAHATQTPQTATLHARASPQRPRARFTQARAYALSTAPPPPHVSPVPYPRLVTGQNGGGGRDGQAATQWCERLRFSGRIATGSETSARAASLHAARVLPIGSVIGERSRAKPSATAVAGVGDMRTMYCPPLVAVEGETDDEGVRLVRKGSIVVGDVEENGERSVARARRCLPAGTCSSSPV